MRVIVLVCVFWVSCRQQRDACSTIKSGKLDNFFKLIFDTNLSNRFKQRLPDEVSRATIESSY
eukprot:m.17301 g.17301  ORF g.17301 m.17301 type:complete len:63 (+) comp10663_c0_seq8:295-483(+)